VPEGTDLCENARSLAKSGEELYTIRHTTTHMHGHRPQQ